MNRRRRIYEGKAKILYEGPEPGTLIQFFKDDATAFNAKKHEIIDGKGVLNNRISEYIFTHLNRIGIPTHFIRRLNMREQLIKEVEIIPLEIVVRNVAAGSLAKRLGIEEGVVLPRSIIEFYYKADALDDPMVSEEHITAFGWASPQELAGQLPSVGCRNQGKDGQGPVPPRYGRPCRGLPGSGPPPWHHERERTAPRLRPGIGKISRNRRQ
jgi:phosphoribosylaminoimidazole-succinocarboxamide synthase